MIRLRLMNVLCVLLRHPAERVDYAGGSSLTRCPCAFIEVYDRPIHTIRGTPLEARP